MVESSDNELVTAAARGDVAAFHALVDRHAARLFRTALALTRSRADAEDVLQETLLGAFRGLKNFGGRSSVKTWLVSILIRQAAKHRHRSRDARSTRSLDAVESSPNEQGALVVQSSAERTDQRLDFEKMLDALPPYYREVMVLREIQQMSYSEIAQALQLPAGTIESRVYRARQQLREHLTAYAPKAPARVVKTNVV